MTEILIKYRDSGGDITERRISDLCKESATTIDAFCHLRNARRPFRLDRIIHAVNPDTGELLNPYHLLKSQGDPETLESITWHAMPAIKALKFFTLSTRGFAKRERERVVLFLQEVANVSEFSKDEIGDWVYKLWCGDLYAYRDGDTKEYEETLKGIPIGLLERCREFALQIARGSGRKPIDPGWLERIELEFSPNPIVKKPEKNREEGASITISSVLPDFDNDEK